MPKHLATQMTRAVTFAALCLALLVPAAPSYAGCPVCAIIKTTPAGRAVPDDNDFAIFDMLDLRDSLIAQPIATGFPSTTQAQVGFLMSSSYYAQTLARFGNNVDTLDAFLGASPFAAWTDFLATSRQEFRRSQYAVRPRFQPGVLAFRLAVVGDEHAVEFRPSPSRSFVPRSASTRDERDAVRCRSKTADTGMGRWRQRRHRLHPRTRLARAAGPGLGRHRRRSAPPRLTRPRLPLAGGCPGAASRDGQFPASAFRLGSPIRSPASAFHQPRASSTRPCASSSAA